MKSAFFACVLLTGASGLHAQTAAPPVDAPSSSPPTTELTVRADEAPPPSAAPAKAAPRKLPWDPKQPPWIPKAGEPDLSMRIARLAPPNLQRWALLAVELAVPLACSVVAALVGTALGGVGAWLVFSRARDVTKVPVSTVMSGATVGGFAFGAVAFVAADTVMSAGHPERVLPSRLAGLLLLAPVPLAMGVYGLLQAVGYYRLGPYTQASASVLAWTGFALSYTVLPVAALLATVGVRVADEFVRGPVVLTPPPPEEAPAAP